MTCKAALLLRPAGPTGSSPAGEPGPAAPATATLPNSQLPCACMPGPLIHAPRADGSASGMIMMNSNGMDVVLTNDTMRFSMIGGVLDMYFLMGPTPFDVTDQLTQIVGRPALPPYWSLGFMNSKCASAGRSPVQAASLAAAQGVAPGP